MTVHMVKLCVGAETVDDLAVWAQKRAKAREQLGGGRMHEHVTRMRPKRTVELLDCGSLYWVIKGVILVRQRILGFETRQGSDGVQRCAILLEPDLVLTEPQPRRAFQGWRYLPAEDAPKDMARRLRTGPPPELSMELAELGLL